MPTTKAAYWQNMKDKAAANVAKVSEQDMPETEYELKERIAHVMRHGNCHEKAEVLIEAMEYMISCLELKSHMYYD